RPYAGSAAADALDYLCGNRAACAPESAAQDQLAGRCRPRLLAFAVVGAMPELARTPSARCGAHSRGEQRRSGASGCQRTRCLCHRSRAGGGTLRTADRGTRYRGRGAQRHALPGAGQSGMRPDRRRSHVYREVRAQQTRRSARTAQPDRPARHQHDADRIAALAPGALGIHVLCRSARSCRRTRSRPGPEGTQGTRALSQSAGRLPARTPMSDTPFDPCEHAPAHIRSIAPYQPGKPITELARELGLEPDSIVKLASNENPLGMSPHVLAAIQMALPELHRYPDNFALTKRIATRLDRPMESIVLGNGSNDVLEMVAAVFLGPGRSSVFSQHAFAVYPLATQARG